MRKKTHVGVFFREEFLECGRVSISEPWTDMGIGYGDYIHFLVGGTDVTEEMLRGLEILTGVPYNFWYNMQYNYDKWLASATLQDYLDNKKFLYEWLKGTKELNIFTNTGGSYSNTTPPQTLEDYL